MPNDHPPLRVGAVNYLNSKPLVYGLARDAGRLRVVFDLPSRLADQLALGAVDVALVPVVELFTHPEYVRVSDACIACRGPVRSVKVYFRTPPADVRRLALDEGSRTSIVLAQLLLAELGRTRPEVEPLPIGEGLAATEADAVLLIGDRAMYPQAGEFAEIWDLGQRWCEWTGLPFVFAVWAARQDIDTEYLAKALAQARDEGLLHLDQIVERESQAMGIDRVTCLEYLRDNLHFRLGPEELAGLARFAQLARDQELVEVGNGLQASWSSAFRLPLHTLKRELQAEAEETS